MNIFVLDRDAKKAAQMQCAFSAASTRMHLGDSEPSAEMLVHDLHVQPFNSGMGEPPRERNLCAVLCVAILRNLSRSCNVSRICSSSFACFTAAWKRALFLAGSRLFDA